jgi:hypothetical protein
MEMTAVTVDINGVVHKTRWGDTFFSLPPGNYEVSVWCRWFFTKQMGRRSLMVVVSPGKISELLWTVPGSVFGKGQIKQTA